MKYTNTGKTICNEVTVEANVDYDVPKAGDTLVIYGHRITLKSDMKIGITFAYDKDAKTYTGAPTVTLDGTNRYCWYADGYSWRPGEYFIKQ